TLRPPPPHSTSLHIFPLYPSLLPSVLPCGLSSFFHSYRRHHTLHSFPTRRSSDLTIIQLARSPQQPVEPLIYPHTGPLLLQFLVKLPRLLCPQSLVFQSVS